MTTSTLNIPSFPKDPKIIFEDESIVVIDKPAGMIVNRADTTRAYLTVQEWVEKKIKGLKVEPKDGEEESEFVNRGGIVHRLDKETSGILVIAKDQESFENLQRQFKNREVKKTYVALVHGKLTPPEGEINVPIGRLPWNRTKFGYLPEGRESKTLYKRIDVKRFIDGKTEEELSLVEVYPQTGRTHQIRVHMRYINFPIFGDELYAGRKIMKRDRKILPRHFLHANKISFKHPLSSKSVEFESPLPQELVNFLAGLE